MNGKMNRLRNIGFILAILAISTVFAARLLAQSTENHIKTSNAIPVSTYQINITDSYTRSRSFSGRATVKRKSALGFELSGTLLSVDVDDGDAFTKGSELAWLDTSRLNAKLEQLIAQRNESAANLQLAKNTHARIDKTNKQGHASAQTLDEAFSRLMAARSRLTASEAAIKSLYIDIDKSMIKAPFDGIVVSRLLDEGTIVPAGASVFNVIESTNLEAKIGVTPALAKRLNEGASFTLKNDLRQPIEGQFKNSIAAIRGQTRTMLATFDITSEVWDGEIITLLIDDTIQATGAWVPVRALSADVRGLWRLNKVVKGKNGPEVRFENVQLLHSSGDMAYVTGSFNDGDIIVREGVGKLAKSQRVNPVPTPISQ